MAIIDSTSGIASTHKKYANLFQDSQKSDMSIETFYKLLMAEMSNQDPLEPMSNTEFVSQMASFTSLQVQQEALYYNNSNYAQSLAGKRVVVASDTGTGFDIQDGTVSKVSFVDGVFTVTVNGRDYPLKNVMEVLDSGYGMASGSDGAFATSLIGKLVTVGTFDKVGNPVIETGIVQKIEIKDGAISVIIDDLAYPLYSVAKIEPPEAAENNNQNNDDD
jgi:flagellar basal-body rod modification protein FlgD